MGLCPVMRNCSWMWCLTRWLDFKLGALLRFDFSNLSANTLFTQLRVSGIVVWWLPDVAVFRLDFLISSVLCSSFSPLLLPSADGNRAILEKFWLVEFLSQQFDFSSFSLSLSGVCTQCNTNTCYPDNFSTWFWYFQWDCREHLRIAHHWFLVELHLIWAVVYANWVHCYVSSMPRKRDFLDIFVIGKYCPPNSKLLWMWKNTPD